MDISGHHVIIINNIPIFVSLRVPMLFVTSAESTTPNVLSKFKIELRFDSILCKGVTMSKRIENFVK